MQKTALSCLIALLTLAPLACGDEPNQAPTAVLSAELSAVTIGDPVVIDGSSSTDPDGDPLLFRWSLQTPEGSSIELGTPRTRTVSFDPDVIGTYTVGLTVDDGQFETDEQRIDIEATDDLIPVADAGPDQNVEVGDEVTLDGTGSEVPEGAAPFYRWSFQQKPPSSQAEFSDSADAQPTFVADVAGDYIVELQITTGDHDSDPNTVVISATQGDESPPVADAGDDQRATTGLEVVLDGSNSNDPDGSVLTYHWRFIEAAGDVQPDLTDATSESARFTPLFDGTYTLELEVTDEAGKTATDTVQVSASCLIISEYIEGSVNNKAVELYNCGTEELDLSGYGMCVVTNDDAPCSLYDLTLSGSLGAGAVQTLCSSSLDSTVLNDPNDCDVSDPEVNFNGDDPIIIYGDVDGSGEFGSADPVKDVFGEIENRPDSEIWQAMTLRRCNFEPNFGQTGFDFSEYYDQFPEDDFSDFGVAPSEGCAN